MLNREYVDCCVVGDGELPMFEIAQGTSLDQVSGVAVRTTTGEISLSAPTDPSLDSYPHPDWSLVDIGVYQDSYRRRYEDENATYGCINSQKGCMWRFRSGGCIFCGLVRSSYRSKSPERVWEEIEHLVTRYGCNHFWELSDTICSDSEWLERLASTRPNLPDLTFHGYARASEINERTASLLQTLGFKEVFVGIESGDDEVLRRSNKGSTARTNLNATRVLCNNGIKIFSSIVLGLPGESRSSLDRTYRHVEELFSIGMSTLSVCVFTPYPGSRSFEMLKEHPLYGKRYEGADVFDWTQMARIWAKEYCDCTFDDIEKYLEKYKAMDGCHYEDNFSYVERPYDI